jgi:hypothetical protein
MKLAIRSIVFHFLCILIFGILYYNIQSHFQNAVGQERRSFLDYIFLSTTIQASVGITDIYPVTTIGKLVMILQQLLMIMTHVFTLYFINL